MKPFAILTATPADIPDVVTSLADESRADLAGFEQDAGKWAGMVEKMMLDSEYAYTAWSEGRALCLFGATQVDPVTFETWMLYREEFKELRGVTQAVRALFDAEFDRTARRIKTLRVRVLSRLTLPQSADWLVLLGFNKTDRRIVTPNGQTAYVFERAGA